MKTVGAEDVEAAPSVSFPLSVSANVLMSVRIFLPYILAPRRKLPVVKTPAISHCVNEKCGTRNLANWHLSIYICSFSHFDLALRW